MEKIVCAGQLVPSDCAYCRRETCLVEEDANGPEGHVHRPMTDEAVQERDDRAFDEGKFE